MVCLSSYLNRHYRNSVASLASTFLVLIVILIFVSVNVSWNSSDLNSESSSMIFNKTHVFFSGKCRLHMVQRMWSDEAPNRKLQLQVPGTTETGSRARSAQVALVHLPQSVQRAQLDYLLRLEPTQTAEPGHLDAATNARTMSGVFLQLSLVSLRLVVQPESSRLCDHTRRAVSLYFCFSKDGRVRETARNGSRWWEWRRQGRNAWARTWTWTRASP